MAMAVRNCLGVDIGSQYIRVAQLELGKAGPRVLRMVETPVALEPGLTEVQRAQKLAKQLTDLLKSNGIRLKNAVFSVPGQSVFVRRIKLPKTTPERIDRIIRFEARQQIPFPLEQTIMEYQVFEEAESPEANVLLVAIKKEFIRSFMRIVRRSGLRPIGISVSSLALYNFHELNSSTRELGADAQKKKKKADKKGQKPAADAKPKKSFLSFGKKKEAEPEPSTELTPEDELPPEDMVGYEEIKAYVNIGASLMDLAIPKPGSARMIGFTRSVPLAGNEMDRVIKDKLGLATAEDARAIKEKSVAVISTEFEMQDNTEAYNMQASEAATAVADRLISELRRSLDFYISQPDGVAVDSLVLSGGLSRLPYLASYIEEKMGLPVEVAQPKHEQLRMPDVQNETFSPYALAVGLGLQGIGLAQNQIDFIPEEEKNIRKLREKPFEAVAMAAMLAIIIALSVNVGESRIEEYSRNANDLQGRINQILSTSTAIQAAQQRRDKVADAYTQLSRAGGWRAHWLDFLEIFYKSRPPDVLIDSLQMRIDGNVVVRGLSPNPAAVNSFIEALSANDPNQTLIKDSQINQIAPANDRRFATQVYQYELTIKTPRLNERLRPVGEAPFDPAAQPQQPGAGTPFGGGFYGQPQYPGGTPRNFGR